MGIVEILAVLALAAAGWFAWDTLKAREAANAAMRAACKAEEMLFLDDTVSLELVRPVPQRGRATRIAANLQLRVQRYGKQPAQR
jgi:hypothetical protein